jgi:hypothetical protein
MKEIEYDTYSDEFCTQSDYGKLIDSMEVETIVRVDEKDYQGDTWALLRGLQGLGYLQFGWGSCSGCDALQSCNTPEEVMGLRDELYESIKWFADVAALKAFMEGHDWVGDYDADNASRKEFIGLVTNWIKAEEARI